MVREERTIEVTLISATDLKKVKKIGREQKCYAAAFIYPARRQTTATDYYGGVNPIWNATLKLPCYETDLHPDTTSAPATSLYSPSSSTITVEIYSLGGGIFHSSDKLVGTITVPLRDVASAAKVGGTMTSFDVHLASGEVHGTINLTIKLGAKRELGEYEDLTTPLTSSDQVS
jgi:hypothetical protein